MMSLRPVFSKSPSGIRPVFIARFVRCSPFSATDGNPRECPQPVESPLSYWRRGSELNRRIKVLQTFEGRDRIAVLTSQPIFHRPASVRFQTSLASVSAWSETR